MKNEPAPSVQRELVGRLRGRPAYWLILGTAWLCWGYLTMVIAAWLLLRLAADRWWPVTPLLFGPRWLLGFPLLLLVPAAAILRRKSLWPLLVASALLLGPIMQVCLPWGKSTVANGPRLRVLTCNVNGPRLNSAALTALIAQISPDVVTLQEWEADSHVAWPSGWHVKHAGQLVLASRHPIESMTTSVRSLPPSEWPPVNSLYAVLRMPFGHIGVCCVHFLTPRQGLSKALDRHTIISPSRSETLSSEIDYRRTESKEVRQQLMRFGEPGVIAGDFNMPGDSNIFREFWTYYQDAFSAVGFGYGHTKYEPIRGWRYGIRIDHILSDEHWHPAHCWVGPDVGSDHLPLIADLVWQGDALPTN